MLGIQIVFLFAIALICLTTKRIYLIYLLGLLLPIHGTIKAIFFNNGGEIFAAWKELAILIVAVRSFRYIRFKQESMYLPLVFVALFFALVGKSNGYPISTDLKNLIFPGLLVLILSSMLFRISEFKKFCIFLFISTIFIDITGVIDFISPVMRLTFRTLMGVTYKISSDGNVFYDTSSFQIMGYDRVAGLMSGGPNQMGVFNGFIVVLCFVIYRDFKQLLDLNKLFRLIYWITLGLASFCLLMSFSRAGWGIVGITLFFFYYRRLSLKMLVLSVLSLAIISTLIITFSPMAQEVITSTFNGDEASSAKRGLMIKDALFYSIKNPLGLGLGATSSSDSRAYFAESAFINLAIQIGIPGFFILSLFYMQIYNRIKEIRTKNPINQWASAFIIAIFVTSFVSVNPYENPFIYFSWLFIGLSLMKYPQFSKIKHTL